KKKALAIFSSDAISSSAYATQEIIRVLAVAGASALAFSVSVSVAIAVLLAVVVVSYRQVCRAYPNGGGAYAVARENLSPLLGLGLMNIVSGAAHPIVTPNAEGFGEGAELSIFLLLKAFAGGSVALTGVEAIANGVPAFKAPEAKNAANTMTSMAILLGVLFI